MCRFDAIAGFSEKHMNLPAFQQYPLEEECEVKRMFCVIKRNRSEVFCNRCIIFLFGLASL